MDIETRGNGRGYKHRNEVDTEKEIEVETDQFLADRHFQSVAANL
jgi:hypothetical protein